MFISYYLCYEVYLPFVIIGQGILLFNDALISPSHLTLTWTKHKKNPLAIYDFKHISTVISFKMANEILGDSRVLLREQGPDNAGKLSQYHGY